MSFLLATALSPTCTLPAPGHAELSTDKPIRYTVGERIDPDTFVLDPIQSEAKVVILVIFGGAVKEVLEGRFRGRLWCQDRFDDLAVRRTVVKELKDRSV